MPHDQSSPTRPSRVVRVGVLLLALGLMSGFVIKHHRAGSTLHSIKEMPLSPDSPEVQLPPMYHPGALKTLISDRYGASAGMITLDSLKRRVESRRAMLHGNKALRIHGSSGPAEAAYLDSLLIAHGIKVENGNRLVADRFGGGGMITLDSLKRRVDHHRMMQFSSKVVYTSLPDQPEWDYLDSLLRVTAPKR